jgi:gamma-glutamyltranspeptidase / glutathione hydrolase
MPDPQHTNIPAQRESERAIAATPHPQAALAAEKILRDGGNAVDAAAAAMCTLCVVMPGMVGLGGFGGSMVVYLGRERRCIAIDFTAPAPIRFSEELYTADPKRLSDSGALSITFPAVLAGLNAAIRNFGTKTWRDVAAHAADVAENGVEMYPQLRRHLANWEKRTDPESMKALFPTGKIPEAGEMFVQKDLARLIRRIQQEGPDALYRGEVPREICRQLQSRGGILCEEDFAGYQPRIEQPLSIEYRAHRLFTPPPPSGGITTFAILKTLEQFDLRAMEPWSADYFHLFAEATKLCWRERKAVVGDPAFVKMPMERMLSELVAQERAEQIRRGQLAAEVASPPAGGSTHTSKVTVADGEGNVASLTATQGLQFGSQIVIGGYGLVMGHGMSRFDFTPGSPNFPQPGKRMSHNMAPTIVLRDDQPRFAFGLQGGPRIVTVTAQLALNLINHATSPLEALRSPRVHVEADEPLKVSPNMPPTTIAALAAMGHKIVEGEEVGGDTNVVAIDAGKIRGASTVSADSVAAL